jgi:hypothetical protein
VNRPDEPQDQQQNHQHAEQHDHQQNLQHGEYQDETYNPWSIVNLVFHHLADEGLHPILGATGDPGPPAALLLEAMGIRPAPEGNRQVSQDVKQHLAEIRSAFFGDR